MAVLGDVRDACRGGRLDALAGDVATVDDDTARGRRTQARDRLDQLLLAVAVDPGDRHDLAAADGQRHPVDGHQVAVVADLELLDREDRLLGLRGLLLHRQKHVAADHHPGQALLGGALAGHGADLLAAAQHGDAVGHRAAPRSACG